jgi:CRISPR-associated endonuclease Csn1
MKYLGLDLGTNSIGWAVRDTNLGDDNCQIIEDGVRIFTKGVGEEKNVEFSLAAVRTRFRSARRRYYRRKLRKVATLRALIDFNMCPLSHAELDLWANYRKEDRFEYPQGVAFQEWLEMNPYECRLKASKQKAFAYEIGRALYHICQRRGFKSGKKDAAEGALPKDVAFLQKFQEEYPNTLLIDKLAEGFANGRRVRLRPNPQLKEEEVKNKSKEEVKSSRLLYLAEFEAIMRHQHFSDAQKDRLYRAIFFQRNLKSQKHTVGKCTLENSKRCGLLSSPTYELFRLYQQLNNVRVKTNYDVQDRPLDEVEKKRVSSLFFRKSEVLFDFEEVTKLLNKNAKKTGVIYTSNYDGKRVSASGCPTIARLMEYCGEDWQHFSKPYEYDYNGILKMINVTAYDIWHVWETMEDSNRKQWAMTRLELSEEDADRFSRVRLKDGYASLSEKAMKKILPFLEKGYIYSLAVFLANIDTVIGKEIFEQHKTLIISELDILLQADKEDKILIDAINAMIAYFRNGRFSGGGEGRYTIERIEKEELLLILASHFGEKTWTNFSTEKKQSLIDIATKEYVQQVAENRMPTFLKKKTLEEKIKNWLVANFDFDAQKLDKLYHPSAIEVYQRAEDKLGSPKVASVRNPMAMRTLHELRYLINDLLAQKVIDDDTHTIIELSRDLNDANKRKAIQSYQKIRETERNNDRKEVILLYKEHHKIPDYQPTEADLLRYRLWIEQNKRCIYTDKEIGCADLFNGELWDFEHTLPRSRSFDDSQANITLCDAEYNRKTKLNKTPFELFEQGILDKEVILTRLKHWKKKIDELKFIIDKNKRGGANEDKEMKDNRIQRKHRAYAELEYIGEKYRRFTMEEIKNGFKNSQLVDTGIITKYATLFLKSYFKRVSVVKGTATDKFRRLWGLPEKSRDSHSHHLKDAIVISCMTHDRYNSLAAYYQNEEKGLRPSFAKPWKNFNQDLERIANEAIIAHSFRENTLKQTKRRMFDEKGNLIPEHFVQGKGIRGSLHKDTLYGKIIAPSDNQTHFVKRINVSDLKETDLEKIVDERIKRLFETVGLKEAQSKGIALPPKKEGGIATPIHKVRIFQDKMAPMPIRENTHRSEKENREHKHFVYAANDENYALAIYKNDITRDFELVNLLKLAKSEQSIHTLFPAAKTKTDKRGNATVLPLYKILQSGKSVLLLENDNDKVNWDDKKEIQKRLFVIRGLSIMNLKVGNAQYVYSKITLIRHYESKRTTELTIEAGEFLLNENKSSFRMLYHSQFYGLVEGVDFTMSPSGDITPIV